MHDPLCFEFDRSGEDGFDHSSESPFCYCELISRVRADERANYVNDTCCWGYAKCIADCPSCKRMDELIAERRAGYNEGKRDMAGKYNSDPLLKCLASPFGRHYNFKHTDKGDFCGFCHKNVTYLFEMGQ